MCVIQARDFLVFLESLLCLKCQIMSEVSEKSCFCSNKVTDNVKYGLGPSGAWWGENGDNRTRATTKISK